MATTNKVRAERVAELDVAALARAARGAPHRPGVAARHRARHVGAAQVLVDYSRPSVRGRTVWGGALVPYGQVWRTGANAATQLVTSADLTIGGAAVPAGTYTLFTLPAAEGGQLIVNRKTGEWGTEYESAQDLVRIPLQRVGARHPGRAVHHRRRAGERHAVARPALGGPAALGAHRRALTRCRAAAHPARTPRRGAPRSSGRPASSLGRSAARDRRRVAAAGDRLGDHRVRRRRGPQRGEQREARRGDPRHRVGQRHPGAADAPASLPPPDPSGVAAGVPAVGGCAARSGRPVTRGRAPHGVGESCDHACCSRQEGTGASVGTAPPRLERPGDGARAVRAGPG
jgi:hypothetical protein